MLLSLCSPDFVNYTKLPFEPSQTVLLLIGENTGFAAFIAH